MSRGGALSVGGDVGALVRDGVGPLVDELVDADVDALVGAYVGISIKEDLGVFVLKPGWFPW
jgi:hypothetical protein